MVHDKYFCRHRHLGSVHGTRKLDPDLMSEKSLRTIIRTIMDKNMELLKLLCLCASYDPVWIILMIFVSCNGVLSQEFPTASSVFTHIFALIIIISACQYELRLLLFVCVCARQGEGSIYCHFDTVFD